MKVLIFEQFNGGHYENYLNCLIPVVAGLCDQLVIATNRSQLESSTMEVWSRLPNIDFFPLSDVSPRLSAFDRMTASNNLVKALGHLRPNFSILPSADAQATMLAGSRAILINRLRPYGQIEATIHCGYGYSATSITQRIKEAIYSQTIRRAPFSFFNFVNFRYFEYALANHLLPPHRARLVGDPVPQPDRIGKAAARRLLGLQQDGRYLGILGSLDHRKAIPEILAAFKRANLARTDRLLLAGRLAPHFLDLAKNEYRDMIDQDRIIILDRFLTESELAHGYEALDIATIAYRNFPGLASLALKAIAAGTPIIGNEFGWLGALICRFPVGTSVDIQNTDRFAEKLSVQLDVASNGYDQPEATRRLLSFHSIENFVSLMTNGLRRAQGLPEENTVDWEWVLSG